VITLAGQGANSAPTSAHFKQSITSLENITTPGITRIMAFGSVVDITTAISSLPPDIAFVGYGTEEGLTPQNELNSLASSIAQAAQVAHSHNRKLFWVPGRRYFDSMQSDATLASTLSSVDMVAYQSQKLLTTDQNYTQDMQGKYAAAKSANPNIIFYLQLWVGTNGSTDQQIIDGFNGLVGFFDVAGIGGGGGSHGHFNTIISGLSWRK
jgi:hypothetical protein